MSVLKLASLGDCLVRALGGLMCWVVCISLSATSLLLASQQGSVCDSGDASRAAAQIECLTQEQLGEILSYRDEVSSQRLMRETLATAVQLSRCVNDFSLFPEAEQRKDFHCLQHQLLDFYERISQSGTPHGELHFEDRLARASLDIHYCMIDEELGILNCLKRVEEALKEYQSVFRVAAQIKTDPEVPSSAELAEAMGISIEVPAPDFSILEEFIDLALENSLRFPRVLGKQIGTALGPILCDAYQLYPQHRDYIAQRYNFLIRFDGGNMASSGQLHQFMEDLIELFRPARGLASFLRLRATDWSRTPPPCSADDLMFVFPEFVVLPGYRLPSRQKLEQVLDRLEGMLAQTVESAERRMHLWKPFYRYGTLLFGLAQSLKVAGSRSQQVWGTRHLLMERARDALLLRRVASHQHPYDPEVLQASISQQIQIYGEELLSEQQLDPLIDFAEGYLGAGEALLTEQHTQQLHRLLAISYAVRGEQSQVRDHLQKSDLALAELDKIQERFRELGIGPRGR